MFDAWFWICGLAATLLLGGLYFYQEVILKRQSHQPRTAVLSGESLVVASYDASHPIGEAQRGYASTNPATQPPRERKHTLLAGATNDGKTTTTYTLLVNDLSYGAQCVVCSTHYTAYHFEDQQIDLRPIADRFEAYYTLETIKSALLAAGRLIDERMHRYRANQDVGHDVVLYIGEWGAIQRVLGKQAATELIQKILDEGRKTRVWIGAIELHSAVVSRFGDSSALREAFKTRLAGNIDDTTWRFVVGRDTDKRPVPPRHWMTSEGLIAITRPTAADIARITHQPLIPHRPLLNATTAADTLIGRTYEQPKAIITDDYILLDGTGSDGDEGAISASDTDDGTGLLTALFADTNQQNRGSEPVQKVAPMGTSSAISRMAKDEQLDLAIKLLSQQGFGANVIIGCLQLSGSRDEKLARIRRVSSS